ncbi:HCL481Wp [Eremothecium sinecaudum]|uniref:HCL481Wp n=1 Tax=Eremothecium sinecaudum TaxID=45286 RepID=A0A109UY70_9SACH|nr:HCL481Wp [Eremothecium sinecaudum]AMD19670.1 HCL481Wp [Eremothecium sinecaudum]
MSIEDYIPISRRAMDAGQSNSMDGYSKGMKGQQRPELPTGSARSQILLNDPNTDHIYLKVTPNLFTAEKLHLFEAIDMYTSFIKCAKFLENGERLHNLSWRIMNKSLLKEHDINRSKTRDGVKNLYNVINPANQKGLLGSLNNGEKNQNIKAGSNHVLKRDQYVESAREETEVTAANPRPHSEGYGEKNTSVNETISRRVLSSTNVVPSGDPKFVRTASLFACGNHNYGHGSNATHGQLNQLSLFAQKSEEIGAQGKQQHQNHQHNGNTVHSLFYSSDDEESDWDSISEDSFLYDDDDYEDEFYEKQWDKLMFNKNKINSPSISPPHCGGDDEGNGSGGEIKKSLLSDLFLHKAPRSNGIVSPNTSINSIGPIISRKSSAAATGASNVTALGSLSSSPSQSKINGLSEILNGNGLVSNLTLPAQTIRRISRRGSFSSIASESTRERYNHESNAPPTAQTILPTALSTHMFPPNTVRHKRMNSIQCTSIHGGLSNECFRKECVEIPCKNRNNGLLKTRMELSAEEIFNKEYQYTRK